MAIDKRRNRCEVCNADSSETEIITSVFKGFAYCRYDLDRAIMEGWHK